MSGIKGRMKEFRARRMDRVAVAVCITVMVLGIGIRFTNLAGKTFGNDEATTSVHVSGKTIAQYAAAMFDGRERTARKLLTFQEPDRAHGVYDVVRSLAVEDPQHPPAYYVVEREWELVAGSSVSARRLLPALFGAVAVFMAVWFGYEVFSLECGLFVGAIVSASPFAIAYSQVAREYSLWLAITFAASALLIRAGRSRRTWDWLMYTLLSLVGLYTDVLFALVLFAHAAAVPFLAQWNRRTLIGFCASLLVLLAGYMPWINALANGYINGAVTNNTYLSSSLPLKLFVLKWIFNVGCLFYDADYILPTSAVLILPGLTALVLAFVCCVLNAKKNTRISLIFALGLTNFLALVVPDLAHHLQRSTASRYLIPLWVACYGALGIALATAVRSPSSFVRKLPVAFILLTACTGFGSYAISTNHDTWWVDGSTGPVRPIARAIEATHQPLVVYHSTWGGGSVGPEIWDFTIVILANMVPATTKFVQYPRDQSFALPMTSETLLLLDPNDAAIQALKARNMSVKRIAGGAEALNGDIAVLRKSALRERERSSSVNNLSPPASLWMIRANRALQAGASERTH